MSTNKRTRSQLTLSDFNFSKLAHSPFKHARTTLRSHSSQPASSDISVEDIGAYNRMRGGTVDGDGDDGSSEMILAPRTESKRPSSPLEDSVPLPTRELKRPKHDHHIQPNLLRKPTSASAPARRSGPSTNKKTSATLCAAPRLTRSSSFSFAQPTASSAAKGSSAKPHSIAASSGIGIHSTAPYASRPSSSLSMLSLALEKLNVPPPIRPNTSMGFHRDTVKGDSDDEGDTSESTGNADRTVRYGKGKTNGGRDNSPHASGPFSGAHPRAILLQRSATVGDLSGKFTTPSSSKTTPRQSTLMLPPPLPSIAKPGVTVSSRRIIGASGQVKPTFTVGHGRVQHPTGSARAKIFAVGAGAAMHNRVFQRVSQKSSLPTVQGSPVKGGSRGEDLSEPDMVSGTEVGGSIETGERDDGLSSWSSAAPTFTPGGTLTAEPMENGDGPDGEPSVRQDTHENDMGMGRGKGKEREKSTDVRKRDASRRASLASQFLSQSLTALPYTPASLDPREGPATGPTPRVARRSHPPTTRSMVLRSAPGALTRAGGNNNAEQNGGGTGAHVSAHPRRPAGLKDGDMNTSPAGGALAVLLACTIFVDVRTDEGDDAGALFVDMLKGMGARITSRVGQRCTHIVYKNGLMSTLTRYRLLNEPKPHVVGIAWVVECVEQRARVDEARFIIDLAGMNVAGTNKRRRSMLPKQLLRVDSGSSSIFSPGPSDFADTNGGPRLAEVSSSRMAVDDEGDSIESIGVGLSDDSLPPLEKARRRRSMLPTRSALQGS